MPKTPHTPVELWSYNQISEHTGIAPGTLRAWRVRGKLAAADFKIGDYLAWKPDTIRKWWSGTTKD